MSISLKKIIASASANLPFIFKTLLIWYLVAVFMEMVFKGFVTQLIDLDIFLWLVIIIGVVTFIFYRKLSL